jgi:hypothetical protein
MFIAYNAQLTIFIFFFSYGALAYLHETLRFTSVFLILDRR